MMTKHLECIHNMVLPIILLLAACSSDEANNTIIRFGEPEKVTVHGYDDHLMEPFISPDGDVLLFNNLNDPAVNTNIHWATRTDDRNFEYQGEVAGINTPFLEGVPTMDENNRLYFISTRSYDDTHATIYRADFMNGNVSAVNLLEGLSKNEPGWVNFDVEVSADGIYLYFVDGRFDASGGPYEADIVIAKKNANGFERLGDQSILQAINTDDLEYAACISKNGLELYFTRVKAPLTSSSTPRIYVATRASADQPFQKPVLIDKITGFAEGPTLSADNKMLYYHHMENEKFSLFMIPKLD